MPIWIALFRGVNVGGRHRMTMSQLVEMLESLGFGNPRTYIQSGNVIFSSRTKNRNILAGQILDGVERRFGFRPALILLTDLQFRLAVKRNPFGEPSVEPKSLHFVFLESSPLEPDLEGLGKLTARNERFRLIGDVFYIHAPDGIGRSKLAAGTERKLGVVGTARNLQTIQALSVLLDEA